MRNKQHRQYDFNWWQSHRGPVQYLRWKVDDLHNELDRYLIRTVHDFINRFLVFHSQSAGAPQCRLDVVYGQFHIVYAAREFFHHHHCDDEKCQSKCDDDGKFIRCRRRSLQLEQEGRRTFAERLLLRLHLPQPSRRILGGAIRWKNRHFHRTILIGAHNRPIAIRCKW